jgi:hypothetical protein
LKRSHFYTALCLTDFALGTEAALHSTTSAGAISRVNAVTSRSAGSKSKKSKSSRKRQRGALMDAKATARIAYRETTVKNIKFGTIGAYAADGDSLIDRFQRNFINTMIFKCVLVIRSGIAGNTDRVSDEIMRAVLTDSGVPVIGFGHKSKSSSSTDDAEKEPKKKEKHHHHRRRNRADDSDMSSSDDEA